MQSRKMGFLEEIGAIFQDAANRSTMVTSLIKVENEINFSEFENAWHILFKRKPMLRARPVEDGVQHAFEFDVKFSSELLNYYNTTDFDKVEDEYSRDIFSDFNYNEYLWRSTLFNEGNTSYIVFAASHSISDGKSISQLLADLLQIISQVRKNLTPNEDSEAVPEPLDDILDKSLFEAEALAVPEIAPQEFAGSPENNPVLSKNLFAKIEEDKFKKLYALCKEHNVTITAVLLNALLLAANKQDNKDSVLASTAVNFRPYTKNKVDNSTLAFYAHQIMFKVDISPDDFWQGSKNILETYRNSLKHYQLIDVTDENILKEIKQGTIDNMKSHKVGIPTTISNVGVTDNAFNNAGEFTVSEFYFSVYSHLLFGIILFAATVKNNLFLDFSYCTPVMTDDSVLKLRDDTLEIIDSLIS